MYWTGAPGLRYAVFDHRVPHIRRMFEPGTALPPPTIGCRTRHSTHVRLLPLQIILLSCTRDDRRTAQQVALLGVKLPFPSSQIPSAADIKSGIR